MGWGQFKYDALYIIYGKTIFFNEVFVFRSIMSDGKIASI